MFMSTPRVSRHWPPLSADGAGAPPKGCSTQWDACLRSHAALAAAWGIAGSALAWQLARRREGERQSLAERVAGVRAQRERMAEELKGLKARGLNAELAHREASALYGMVKSLSEAMSWEEARPRVEGALEQYFGPRVEYALYVAGLRGEGEVRPLAVRGLRASPGAAWATLERLMQEQGATAASPRAFEKPERSVGVPIKEGQELLGYLYARVPEGAAADAWLAKTQSFVGELGVAFRRVKLFQEVERLSEIDGLTGVRRRGAFDKKIAEELVRGEYLGRVHIGLDFFDASINRIAAWTIGARAMIRQLLIAMLEPIGRLRQMEIDGDFTSRLAMLEELKAMPFGAVWDYYCLEHDAPVGIEWMVEAKRYESDVLSRRV